MELGQEVNLLGDWVVLSFTENLGMAFGMELGGETGKIALSLFRVLAVVGIAFYLRYLIKKKVHKGLLTAIALICAGALGNILDSAFYGGMFNMGLSIENPHYYFGVAEIVWGTDASGYAPFLHGSVVDMIKVKYFPAVFNLADMSISFGVGLIIIFQKRYFAKEKKEVENDPAATEERPASAVAEPSKEAVVETTATTESIPQTESEPTPETPVAENPSDPPRSEA